MRLPLCQSSPSFPVGVSPLIMSVHFCLALLALCSLTTAADPDCEELLQPLQDQSQAGGKWILHVATADGGEALNGSKQISSSWIEVLPIAGSDDTVVRWADKIDGKCVPGSINVTSSGNASSGTFHFNGTQHDHVWKYVKTCPDCVLWSGTSDSLSEGGVKTKSRTLVLFTKSGKLDDEHLEVFKKQAACLNFPPDFLFGDTDLCPDEKEASTDAPVREE